ncbi:CAS/CSE protein [Cercophora newfieldiana]|uniref:CAS/CSE protein n=1 Tax=Cercophora newfieldiana TaxID=92897 RepID=A0AA39YGU4_9PEZI|nr:CAS/CSE protein [Cercophora newfieldiana]
MASNTDALAQVLKATLDPQHHRKAENALKEEAKKSKYSLALLSIVSSPNPEQNVRLAAALAFKNFIRHNYVDEEGNYKLPLEEVNTIKSELVGLMISSPPSIRTQLGEAISIIADSDFWERWDTLTQDLVNRLSNTDYEATNGVLEVAHSIFVRWRPLFSSNALNIEVLHVVGVFGQPFIQMLGVADSKIEEHKNDQKALEGWLGTMSLLIRLLYDLTCQDIPPVIESNLQPITALLQKYLSYSNPAFDDEEDEATPVETLKSDICDVLQLFTNKYDSDFSNYVQPFTAAVWNVLSNIGPEKRYDLLVSKALQFLTAVASVKEHAQIFREDQAMMTIVEKVILPNVALRESDIEMFDDEPIEFIRRDLEGSDTDSRRRAATDFLRKLLDTFEEQITKVVFAFINPLIVQGQTDWRAKDTAVYLFLAIAAKGTVTAAQGVKTVNSHVNVVDFFERNIAADLFTEGADRPIAKVNAIKYLYNFRSQLNKAQWDTAIKPLIQNLGSSNYVVYTYAAIAVERVLFLTDDEGRHILPREDIQPYAKDLLEHLFALVERDRSAAKLQENEFLMRCIMRVLIVIKEGALDCGIDNVVEHLKLITNIIKENPSNPRFYYYHFEAIGALVRFCSGSPQVNLFQKFWDTFYTILVEDVSEFVPYVFQIFALLLELNPTSELPGDFKALLDNILAPGPWDTRGNVPPLARFMSAIMPKAASAIVAEQKLEPILTIFQRLLTGKKTEQNAFDILEAVIASFPATVLEPYFGVIVTLIFQKIQAGATDSLKSRVTRFYHLVSARTEQGMGADFFIKHAEAVQANVFTPFYLTVIMPTTAQFARPVDRKLGVISYTKTLCESTSFAQRYAKGWGFTCNNLLDLLKNAPKVATGAGDEIVNEADVDDIGFGVGFTPLNTCKRGARDDFPEIVKVEEWVSVYMKQANQRHGGAIAKFVEERLTPEAKAALQPYLA